MAVISFLVCGPSTFAFSRSRFDFLDKPPECHIHQTDDVPYLADLSGRHRGKIVLHALVHLQAIQKMLKKLDDSPHKAIDSFYPLLLLFFLCSSINRIRREGRTRRHNSLPPFLLVLLH